ncbi:hypothetical protein [Umezawaea sp.]|uniref:hypothetical protein n=1 Tax=Umezawaea sp. TaxID=1955258 RepID=UPI002ED6A90C
MRAGDAAVDVVVPSLLVSVDDLTPVGSVVLLWAVGQLVVGHDRHFDPAEFRRGARRVLARFGPDGATPEEAVQSLVGANLWEGTGFTRRVAGLLRNRVLRAQVVDVVRDRSVVVDVDGLLAEVGLSGCDSVLPTALEIIEPLVGQEIRTVTGAPNRVLALRGSVAVVATDASPDGEPVPVLMVQNGLDLLRRDGSVGVTVRELGYRSAFVGAVLATLPGAAASTRPARITLTGPVDVPVPDDPRLDGLDGVALRPYRREQGRLRRALLGDRVQAPCDLCGHLVPAEFLVAAHVKRRSECSPAERADVRNVAMLACVFGCDHLYEAGHVTVDATGTLVATPAETELTGLVGEHLRRLHGRRCTAHRAESEQYFAWHRREFSASV